MHVYLTPHTFLDYKDIEKKFRPIQGLSNNSLINTSKSIYRMHLRPARPRNPRCRSACSKSRSSELSSPVLGCSNPCTPTGLILEIGKINFTIN